MSFASCLSHIFDGWSALQQLNCENPLISPFVVEATLKWFTENKDLEAREVSNFLEELIVDNFNAEFDESDYDQLGAVICKFDAICKEQNSQKLEEELRKLPGKAKVALKEETSDSSEEDEEEMEVDKGPIVDQDGFTLVQRKK